MFSQRRESLQEATAATTANPASPPTTAQTAATTPEDSPSKYQLYEELDKPAPAASTAKSATTSSWNARQWLFTFWSMTKIYFMESSEGRCTFGGLLVLMLLNSAVRVYFSFLARDFWTALGDLQVETFYQILRQFLLALLILAPITVLYRYQQNRLAIQWRAWMTHRILQLYFSNRVYYTLERTRAPQQLSPPSSEPNSNPNQQQHRPLDNPDQRIAEDVRSFTQYSLSLFLTVAVSVIDLSAFSVILYIIQPLLFWSVIGFATVGTIATVLIGKRLVALNFDRLSKEADFRYSLVRTRDHAESIAFFRGEEVEKSEIERRFGSVIANAFQVIGTQRNLDFFTTLYTYLTWILPVAIIAPEYFAGAVELGVIQQAAAAFGHVLEDLSLVITEFESLSEFSASIGRLHQFLKGIQEANGGGEGNGTGSHLLALPPSPSSSPSKSSLISKERPMADGLFRLDDVETPTSSRTTIDLRTAAASPPSTTQGKQHTLLSIRNLCLATPDEARQLIECLNLELQWGDQLLIVGPSGVGKSSLLRAIAGLWTSGSGVIERGVPPSDIFFLPQTPYCPLGTLRDQLLYPYTTANSRNTAGKDEGDQSAVNYDGNIELTSPSADSPMVSSERLLEILAQVDLFDLALRGGKGDPIQGLDQELDWSHTLSLGEQQRLAFGRILVHRPKLVVLDESTSAMDVASETKMYQLLQEMNASYKSLAIGGATMSSGGGGGGTTYISVGHRPTLLQHHTTRLYLSKDRHENTNGKYSVEPIVATYDSVSK